MRKALVMTLASIASIAAFSSAANARDGCGDGWHRNYYGDCVANGSRYYRDDPRFYRDYRDRDFDEPEVGIFYNGRGYWNGDRYYWHRRWIDGDWHYW